MANPYASAKQRIIVGILFMAAAAGFYFWMTLGKAKPATEKPSDMAAGQAGEEFRGPTLEKAALVRPLNPITGQPTAPADDPRLKALNAPIMMGNATGGGTPAATRTAAEGSPPLGGSEGELDERLKPTVLDGTRATVVAHPEFTIAQGTIIPCQNQTPLNSTLPGFVNATIPNAVYSMSGHVVLLESGTKLFGSVQKGLANGEERLFVLWQQATTPAPNFVRIALNSPAADELGVTGLDGDIDQHMWRKIKGVLMLSLIQGGIQSASNLTQHGGSNNSTFNLNSFQSGGDQLANTMLQSTINIPDTLHRDQALACSVFVARDLDFSKIYGLKIRR